MTDDKHLIEQCLQGSRRSFEGLVKKFQNHVIALSINILGNYDDALDIAQETFVQAYTHLDRFDPERKFKTWILSIAAKRCLDHLKKSKSFLNYFLKQTREFQLNMNPHFTHKPIEESEIFYPLLKKMKDKERVALLLKVNENHSFKEMKKGDKLEKIKQGTTLTSPFQATSHRHCKQSPLFCNIRPLLL